MPRACSAASADSMPRPIGTASAAVRAPRSSRAAERLALEQLHGDEHAPGVLADLVDLADVGMVDAGGGAGLAPQALPGGLVRRRRRQRLEGDGPGQPFVTGGVDHAHPAFAELALDLVVADPRRDGPVGAGRGRRDLTGRVVRPARGHGNRSRPRQPLIEGTKAPARSLGTLTTHRDQGIIPRAPADVRRARRAGRGVRREGIPLAAREAHAASMGQAAVPLRIDKISVGGGVGLLVGIVVAAMLVELPVLRWPLGTVCWRRARLRRRPDSLAPSLALKSDARGRESTTSRTACAQASSVPGCAAIRTPGRQDGRVHLADAGLPDERGHVVGADAAAGHHHQRVAGPRHHARDGRRASRRGVGATRRQHAIDAERQQRLERLERIARRVDRLVAGHRQRPRTSIRRRMTLASIVASGRSAPNTTPCAPAAIAVRMSASIAATSPAS